MVVGVGWCNSEKCLKQCDGCVRVIKVSFLKQPERGGGLSKKLFVDPLHPNLFVV